MTYRRKNLLPRREAIEAMLRDVQGGGWVNSQLGANLLWGINLNKIGTNNDGDWIDVLHAPFEDVVRAFKLYEIAAENGKFEYPLLNDEMCACLAHRGIIVPSRLRRS